MKKKDNLSDEKKYYKLVRDKIPEIIENDGEIPFVRVLDDDKFELELKKKLFEEYNELLEASSSEECLEELADMLEVISTLSSLENSNLETVISIMEEKRRKRGGFSKKLFLEKTIRK